MSKFVSSEQSDSQRKDFLRDVKQMVVTAHYGPIKHTPKHSTKYLKIIMQIEKPPCAEVNRWYLRAQGNRGFKKNIFSYFSMKA